MSVYGNSRNIKIWNINNFELILNIENIYYNNGISSACFLTNDNCNYILTSSSYYIKKESIKIFIFIYG